MELRHRVKEGINPTAFADTVVMISPDHFTFNPQTAASNPFQKQMALSPEQVTSQARQEFNHTVTILQENGIQSIVLPSRKGYVTPDAVFPNNWFSTDSQGNLIIYPMLAPNRREERQVTELQQRLTDAGFDIKNTIDLTPFEAEGKYLEGTGSMVFNNKYKVAFAIESPRTNREVFHYFCDQLNYEPIFFHTSNNKGKPIYHTNVIMTVGEEFTVLCADSIFDEKERTVVQNSLSQMGLEIINISLDQMNEYAGNILQLQSVDGSNKIIMSTSAFEAFTPRQRNQLSQHGKLLSTNIDAIETIGGGSARCMLAEIFLPKLIDGKPTLNVH